MVAFSEFLDAAGSSSDPRPELPSGLMRDERYATVVEPRVLLDPNVGFGTRLAMAQYLAPLVEQAHLTDPGAASGLWSWLAVAFFDQICPVIAGKRIVRQRARYLMNDGASDYDFRRAARHLVFSPIYVYGLHPDSPPMSLLCQQPSVHPDMAEQLASYQQLIALPAVVAAVDDLYFDSKRRIVRPGATDRKQAGTIRRLINVCSQLDLTFDLASLKGRELVGLLPKEFNRWRLK
jgi:hypothetical protein